MLPWILASGPTSHDRVVCDDPKETIAASRERVFPRRQVVPCKPSIGNSRRCSSGSVSSNGHIVCMSSKLNPSFEVLLGSASAAGNHEDYPADLRRHVKGWPVAVSPNLRSTRSECQPNHHTGRTYVCQYGNMP